MQLLMKTSVHIGGKNDGLTVLLNPSWFTCHLTKVQSIKDILLGGKENNLFGKSAKLRRWGRGLEDVAYPKP